jgi:hypothetical protein
MQTEERLLRMLQKIRALHARAGTPGERRAAGEAEERILARLRGMKREEAILHRFSIRDPYARRLFFALLERDGFDALRYPRQQAHTIRVRAPREAMDALWREFRGLSARLRRDLDQITDQVVREAVLATERAAESRSGS